MGFNMNEWKEDLSKEAFQKVSSELQQLFINGRLKTEIQACFPLEDHGQALLKYIKNMSGGKVLFCHSEGPNPLG